MIIRSLGKIGSWPRHLLPWREDISDQKFKINGFDITNVEFLGISKLGNTSWKGMINKEKVKIIETGSTDQARTICQIICMPEVKGFFPQLFFRVNKYIVLEWVDGISLERVLLYKAEKYIEDIFWFQYTLHNSLIGLESSYRYNYFDYLSKRYWKYIGPFADDGDKYNGSNLVLDNVQERYFHLDITPRNVVLVGNRIKIIDNELLGYGIYYLFDFLNTYEAVKNHRCAAHYLNLVSRHSAHYLKWVHNSKDVILYYWNLRLSGSQMQSRKFTSPVSENAFCLNTHPIIQELERTNPKNG